MKEIYRIHTVQLRTPPPSFPKKCILGKQSTSANMWTQLNTTAKGKSAQTRPWLSKSRASDDPDSRPTGPTSVTVRPVVARAVTTVTGHWTTTALHGHGQRGTWLLWRGRGHGDR
jgi:hypothetical protein